MYGDTGIGMIIVAVKMSSHCGVATAFDVKDMTLESINYSVLSLSYILCVTPVAF